MTFVFQNHFYYNYFLSYTYIYTFYLIFKILYTISARHGDGHVGSAGRGGTAGLDGHGSLPYISLQPLAPSQADTEGHVVV